MSIANAQGTVYWLTAYKSVLSAKLMKITNERTLLSSMQTARLQQLGNIQTSKITALRAQAEAALKSGSTEDYEKIMEYIEQLSEVQQDSTDSDVTIQIISAKENQLDVQQKALETKLSAVSQNLETHEKLLEANIKEDFSLLNS